MMEKFQVRDIEYTALRMKQDLKDCTLTLGYHVNELDIVHLISIIEYPDDKPDWNNEAYICLTSEELAQVFKATQK